MKNLNHEVSKFLEKLNLPLKEEIEQLRRIILISNTELGENIKWNGPNYFIKGRDCISMRIQPSNQIQLIFHRGAKKQIQPTQKIIDESSEILLWKENDRAIVTFKNKSQVDIATKDIERIITKWTNYMNQ